MKITFDTDKHQYELFDEIFVSMLKEIYADAKDESHWKHELDRKIDKKLAKSCKVLLEYFGEAV